MFSFFKKKSGIKVSNKVWMQRKYKLENIIQRLHKDPMSVCIVWYRSTLNELAESAPAVSERILMAAQVNRTEPGTLYFFGEHHPSAEKEQALFARLKLKKAEVYASLDEPFMEDLIQENFRDMMKKIGMSEDSLMEHSMISAAIRNAQDKYMEIHPVL